MALSFPGTVTNSDKDKTNAEAWSASACGLLSVDDHSRTNSPDSDVHIVIPDAAVSSVKYISEEGAFFSSTSGRRQNEIARSS